MTAQVLALVLVLAMLALAVLVAGWRRSRRADDDIAGFRRQIDALSKESRRPTIDQMKSVDEPPADDDGPDDADTAR